MIAWLPAAECLCGVVFLHLVRSARHYLDRVHRSAGLQNGRLATDMSGTGCNGVVWMDFDEE